MFLKFYLASKTSSTCCMSVYFVITAILTTLNSDSMLTNCIVIIPEFATKTAARDRCCTMDKLLGFGLRGIWNKAHVRFPRRQFHHPHFVFEEFFLIFPADARKDHAVLPFLEEKIVHVIGTTGTLKTYIHVSEVNTLRLLNRKRAYVSLYDAKRSFSL